MKVSRVSVSGNRRVRPASESDLIADLISALFQEDCCIHQAFVFRFRHTSLTDLRPVDIFCNRNQRHDIFFIVLFTDCFRSIIAFCQIHTVYLPQSFSDRRLSALNLTIRAYPSGWRCYNKDPPSISYHICRTNARKKGRAKGDDEKNGNKSSRIPAYLAQGVLPQSSFHGLPPKSTILSALWAADVRSSPYFYFSAVNVYHPVRHRGNRRIMGDYNHGHVSGPASIVKQFQNSFSCHIVQRSRRFITRAKDAGSSPVLWR